MLRRTQRVCETPKDCNKQPTPTGNGMQQLFDSRQEIIVDNLQRHEGQVFVFYTVVKLTSNKTDLKRCLLFLTFSATAHIYSCSSGFS